MTTEPCHDASPEPEIGRARARRASIGLLVTVLVLLAVSGSALRGRPVAARPQAGTEVRTQTEAQARAQTKAPLARTTVTRAQSGLPWPSGVYIPGSSPKKVEAFAAWRRAPLDVVVDWPARATWNDIVSPGWLYQAWAGTPYTKVFGVAPIPEKDDSATMAGCAAGAYNEKWREFGQKIKASGMDDETVIRLGWEFNGNWYKWSAYDPDQYAECWRQIVGTVRTVAPKLLWDWTVNAGPGSSVRDARKAYPGDDYVDIVGVDSYDMYPPVTSEAGWKTHYAGAYGLKFWAGFARDHGKKLSVPEWGVYPGTAHAGHNGGDNPFYVAKMRSFFAGQGRRLAYEAYFNESAPYYAGSLFGPRQNPAAAAKYRALWR